MSPLLDVSGIRKSYAVASGRFVQRQRVNAVDDVSFHLDPHETVALVGESGCGKTTTGLASLRLIEPSAGRVIFDGTDVLALGGSELRELRARMQIVLQNPRSQLDPRMRVRAAVGEPLRAHGRGSAPEIAERVRECLELVGLDHAYLDRFPHQLSGGQRQRVSIARAIATGPQLVVLDEAVSALDVSVQTQILNLLLDLQQQLGMSYLFITHNMAAVRYLADRVVVMYLGRDVESAPVQDFFTAPAHPYSQALLSAVPSARFDAPRERIVLRGDVPSPFAVPSGCVFHNRCPRAQSRCADEVPHAREVASGRNVACHFPLI